MVSVVRSSFRFEHWYSLFTFKENLLPKLQNRFQQLKPKYVAYPFNEAPGANADNGKPIS
jgi:hypothetical protein